jgi:hypothetical protein
LEENLNISNTLIANARDHAELFGAGCLIPIYSRPVWKRNYLTDKQRDQLISFLTDKANVTMSSYKSDSKTGEPIYYLKDTKSQT